MFLKALFSVRRSLSTRLSLWVVAFVAVLFAIVVFVMLSYARQAIKEETLAKTEAALDAMINTIDNTLHEVEVAADNMFVNVDHHLDDPAALQAYTRKMLELNPQVVGCAVAMEPGFYADRTDTTLFCSFCAVDSIAIANHFGNRPFTEQQWFLCPYTSGEPCWSEPTIENLRDGFPIMGYGIPIKRGDRVVGVFVAAISLLWLTETVETTRPSEHTYCALMNQKGDFIIHPYTSFLYHNVFELNEQYSPNKQLVDLAEAMVRGESGYMSMDIYGIDCYVYYRPYNSMGWSIDVVQPKDDTYTAFHQLQFYTIVMVVVGLILLMLYCWHYIHWQMKPLRGLDESAQRLAAGHFDEPIETSLRHDEVGGLQRSFRAMQRSLARYLAEIRQRAAVLDERNAELQTANEKAREADRLKSAFIHNMTDRMVAPVSTITRLVDDIRQNHNHLTHDEIAQMVDELRQQTMTVTQLLDQTIDVSLKKQPDEP